MKGRLIMSKSVYLCGFMGCGKSYSAQKAETVLGINYTDLDDYITETEKMFIPEIFEKHGANYFRECEYNALKKLTGLIALGGGVLTNDKCVQYARENARVIFIDTCFDICYERVKNDPNRPVAFGKNRDELYSVYLSRIDVYRRSADFILTDENEIIEKIKELLIG